MLHAFGYLLCFKLCRHNQPGPSWLGAMQISLIKPLLEAHGVSLVVVGLEQVGVEFIERKFFDRGS